MYPEAPTSKTILEITEISSVATDRILLNHSPNLTLNLMAGIDTNFR